jgi:L-aspartate oxidase
MNTVINTDVLVIGSGIAGLFAALSISEYADVILVTKKERGESNTNYAQGGIASVVSKYDSFEKHIEDTLIAGAGLCDRKTVEIMVKEGPERISDLIKLGTDFTKNGNQFDLVLEGGHSTPRILHSKDLTGKEIERALVNTVNDRKNIIIKENTVVIDLLTEHNVQGLKSLSLQNRNCWGAYILDINSERVLKITSRVTVLATGGVGQVYLHTTNPKIATGDGIAMGYRAGARIANMEFIQFHPTSLYRNNKNSPGDGPSFLISESIRGFGGKLKTKDGYEFMEKYDYRKELAPRDIVARGIDSELKKRGDDFVLLDITHKDPDEIKNHFPHIYNTCLKYGIDITQEPIPVVPAAHYSCGGIIVDKNGRTSLNGLYSCGEVAMTGVHGANRLASNSLLEAIVFSKRAAEDIRLFINKNKIELHDIPEWDDSGTLTADEKVLITHNFKEVKQTMWDYVSIVRSNQRLERAAKRIHNIYEEVEEFYKRTKIFPDILELRNMVTCAHVIIKSAKMRKESRGLHFTLDYPNTFDEAENTILQNTHL